MLRGLLLWTILLVALGCSGRSAAGGAAVVPERRETIPPSPRAVANVEPRCPEPDGDGDSIFDVCDACPTIAGEPDGDGCPSRRVIIREDEQRILQRILFDQGSFQVKPDADGVLKAIVEVLEHNPDIERIVVIGHASKSERGPEVLSLARAGAVVGVIAKRGIQASRLDAFGYGARRPIAPDPQRRDLNRRVEFRLLQRGGVEFARIVGDEIVDVDLPPPPPPPPAPPPVLHCPDGSSPPTIPCHP